MEVILGNNSATNLDIDESQCVEKDRWLEDFDFQCDEEELLAFYQHLGTCRFHSRIVEDLNSDFQLNLIRFNCRLKASQKPRYTGRVKTFFSQDSNDEGFDRDGFPLPSASWSTSED